jgi:hypothetical protein
LEASLVVKASGLRGWQAGPRVPKPLKLVKGFCSFVSRSYVTLSEEWWIALRLLGSAMEPLSLECSGHLLSTWVLACAGCHVQGSSSDSH